MSRIFFAVVASLFLFAGTAMAQPRPQVLRPYAVCGGIGQEQLCEALQWVRQQQDASSSDAPPAAPTPPTAAEREAQREAERRACIAGCPANDAGCACRCRGRFMNPQGTCQGLSDVLASITAVTVDHEGRLRTVEEQLRITVGRMVEPVRVHRSRRRPPQDGTSERPRSRR